ncbi:2-hydroxyacid dehydrogenase [Synechococcus elongatus]|uniref:2-hydroxyacid dehydrogenase n=1 Tax=Synechococcus elongatus TaxID=32046 RepID=UPI000F7E3AA9|nr:2-hydroxyacid dehydrogenase [Synechococcus elongatus]
MKVAFFSSKAYDRTFFEAANADYGHDLQFFETGLSLGTVQLATGFRAVCSFVNDRLDAITLEALAELGVEHVALRCAGFNQVDLSAAERLGLRVVRVPAYSPHAVAEHAIALILTLNRKIHRAYARTREGNFALDGLVGFDLNGRTVGIIGTGRIGAVLTQILRGFGCHVLAHDLVENPDCLAAGAVYTDLDQLWQEAQIISLHCPLTPQTYHLVNREAIAKMQPGTMLINTSRGGLVDTQAVIEGLKLKRIGALGLDVYEQEEPLFFQDHSTEIIHDDVFQRLLTFPNVVITGHQAFLTDTALHNIAETTLSNLTDLEQGRACPNQLFAG